MIPKLKLFARYISSATMPVKLVSLATVLLVLGEPNKALAQGASSTSIIACDFYLAEEIPTCNNSIDSQDSYEIVISQYRQQGFSGAEEYLTSIDFLAPAVQSILANYVRSVDTTGTGISLFKQVSRSPFHLSIVHISSFGSTTNEPVPAVRFLGSGGGGFEGHGPYDITITLDPPPSSEIALNYTLSGSAAPEADYLINGMSQSFGTFIVPAHVPTFNIRWTVIEDNVFESDETVVLTLVSGSGYTLALPSATTMTIFDNEEAPTGVELSEDTLTVVEGREGIYSVSLRSGPDEGATVVVHPRSANPHIRFTPGSLIFDSENWAEPQSIAFAVAEENSEASVTIDHAIDGYGDTRDGVVEEGGTVTVTVNGAEPQDQNEFSYRLCARDHQREDGDDVNIFVNQALVFSNYVLRNEERCETIMLRRSPSRNSVRVQAISVGTPALTGNPPTPNVNTAELSIRHATEDTILENGLWELNAGGQQLWDVYAISENEISLVAREAPSVGTQAVQGTVAAVAAAAVSNVTSNIGSRFSAPTGSASVSLAGAPLAFGLTDPKHEPVSLSDHFDATWGSSQQWRHRSLSGDDLLRTSSFEIALGAAESDKGSSSDLGSRITLWGRGDLQFFESGGDRKSGYDGELAAGYLGADITMEGGWLAGIAVSRIAAEADYTLGSATDGGGTLEAELTSVHPYIRAALNDSSEAWAILGLGTGEVTDTARTGGGGSKSDMSMRMLSAGVRHRLASDMGIDWAVLGDGSFATVETDDGAESIDGITADVWRARLGVEASHTTVSKSGSSFTPFLEVAGRKDGGDGASGLGLELSPGLSFSDLSSGLSIEARGRVLAIHSADDHREYGASVTASVMPGAGGLGLSMAITPSWGTPDNALNETDRGLFLADDGERRSDDRLSLNSRIAWGFAAGRGVLAPFAELSLHDGDRRRMRLGSRYSLGPSLDLELSGNRSDGSPGGPAHSVQISGRVRF